MMPLVPSTGERKLPVAALVLEDDRLWARIISDSLDPLVDEVHHATTLERGVQLWRETRPAVIFVDVGLGRDNGLDFVELVRNEDRTIPLLLVTGDDTREVAVRAINLSVTRFVPKPVTAEQLSQIVEEVLAHHWRALDRKVQEQYFQALVELNADMILVLNGNGHIRYATPSVNSKLAISNAIEHTVGEFVATDDWSLWTSAWDRALSHPGQVVDVTLRVRGTDHRERWLGLRLRNLLDNPDVEGIVLNARDVTQERDTHERLQAAEARLQSELATAESRYRALFDLLPVGVTVADHTGRILDHNAVARDILEEGGAKDLATDQGMIDDSAVQLLDPWGDPIAPDALPVVRALRSGEKVLNEVVGLRDSTGRHRWLSLSAAPYELPHGRTGVIAVYPEITNQIVRQEEQATLLRRVNSTSVQLQVVNGWLREIAQYNDPLERIPDLLDRLHDVSIFREVALYAYDSESRDFSLLGARGVKQWPAEVKGDRFPEGIFEHRQLLVPMHRLDADLRTSIGEIAGDHLSRVLVVPIWTQAGLDGLFVCDSSGGYGRPVRDLAGALAGTIALMMQKHRDSRERERTNELQRYNEKFRMRVERLVAMGSLASAIGHEINQPLQSIKVLADSTLYWNESGQARGFELMADNVRRISERADWAAQIVRSMKVVFSNPDEVESTQVDIADTVQGALDSVEQLRSSVGVTVNVEIAPQAARIRFSEMHLRQVVVNLLKNSLRVLDSADIAEPTVTIRTRLTEGRTRIEVEDNGPGIPTEVQDRIFDPFYSTADRTENMGLGLYVVHTLLKAFNFSIRVEDAPTGGARFVIEEERE